MSQLNLFGEEELVEKPVEQKKDKQKSTAAAQKSQKSVKETKSAPKKSAEDLKVDADWTIYYYGENFRVDEFVDDIPEDGISLEQLREEMAKDFMEMSKDRTTWDFDKDNKRLFPRITGAAKGVR